MCYRLSLVVICYFAVTCSVAAQHTVFSTVYAYGAVRDIVVHWHWQEDLDISPDQMKALTAMLKDERVTAAMNKVYSERRPLKEGGVIDLQPRANLARDEVVKPGLEKILAPEQLKAHRVQYLRKVYFSPRFVFEQSRTHVLYKELELSKSDIAQVKEEVDAASHELREKLTDQRMKAIIDLFRELDEAQRVKFVDLFGQELVVANISGSNPKLTQIEILPETKPTRQLFYSTGVLMPGELAASREQFNQLQSLNDKQHLRWVRNQDRNFDSEVTVELDSVLTPAQRIGLVQRIHRHLLELKFMMLLRPEVIAYLGLNEATLERFRPVVMRWDESIRQQEKVGSLKIFDLGLSKLPEPAREKLVELFDGVWER